MVVGLTITGLVLVLLFYFRNLIGPLLLAFILTYLLHPLAVRLSNTTRLNWRTAVSIIYFILIILVAGLITLTGLAVIQQIQNVIQLVQDFINNLPTLFADLTTRAYTLGPFTFDLSQFDLKTFSDQLLGSVQPLLGRLGSLVSSFATSALTSFAWGLFILVISYFLLADGGQVPDTLNFMHIPGYDADIKRIGRELGRTWNAFLRGQLIIMVLIILLYMVLLNIFGVRYAIAIAILAGLAKFVPYVGPFMTWLVTAMVIIFTSTSSLRNTTGVLCGTCHRHRDRRGPDLRQPGDTTLARTDPGGAPRRCPRRGDHRSQPDRHHRSAPGCPRPGDCQLTGTIYYPQDARPGSLARGRDGLPEYTNTVGRARLSASAGLVALQAAEFRKLIN